MYYDTIINVHANNPILASGRNNSPTILGKAVISRRTNATDISSQNFVETVYKQFIFNAFSMSIIVRFKQYHMYSTGF